MPLPGLHALRPAGRRWVIAAAALAALYLLVGLAAPLLLPHLAPGSGATRLLEGWRATLRDGFLIIAVFAVAVPSFAALRPGRVEGWMRPATPEALGAVRTWIAVILLASVAWEDLPSSAYLPRAMLNLDQHLLIGTLHGLPIGFDRMMASPGALRVFEAATALLLGMAAVGLFTRWTVPAGAVAYMLFAAILRSYAWSYHMGLIPLYALLLLSFTPCGDAFSLDRWRRKRRGEPVPPAREPRLRYGIGRYLVWMGIAIPYTLAALSKLRNTGFGWWRGEHMKQMLVSTVVEPMHFDFGVTFRLLHAPGWMFDALGLAAILGELTFVLVLVSVAARRLLPLLMAGMHGGILLMQNILFPDLIAIQAVFYDWTPLRRRLVDGWMRMRGVVRGGAADSDPSRADGGAGERARIAPEEGVDGWSRRQALVARGFLLLALVVWATRTETFPLTAMQMFSRPLPLEPVEYVRPMAVYADGTRERARLERWIGALADTRYRRLLRDWEGHPERVPVLRELLDACARRANAGKPPGRRIRRFELEHRRWDFRAHPDDPDRGELLDVLIHQVPVR
jgi:hypothetical protein